MNRTNFIVAVLFVVVLVVAGLALVASGLTERVPQESEDLAVVVADSTATDVPEEEEAAPLPLPGVTVLATSTPRPSATPAPTDPPTDTPEPSPTTAPATDTPVPAAVVLPTNTPAPPPTNTPAPTSPPADTRGLRTTNFGLQPRSVFQVNQPVWFEFTIVNEGGVPVPFGALGVMPKKDGVDRPEWYQHSWGGNNDAIPSNGLSHEDNIKLPEAGNYTLRLVMCFESYNTCINGGPWVTMSQEIPVTIN